MVFERIHQSIRQLVPRCRHNPAALAWVHAGMAMTRPQRWFHARRCLRQMRALPRTEIIHPGRHKLVIVATMSREDAYLPDWIRFHQRQGVSHFFLYDSAETEQEARRTRALLTPWLHDEESISYIRWPFLEGTRVGSRLHADRTLNSTQELAYYDFMQRFAAGAEYYTKIDIDEFLFDSTGGKLSDALNFRGVVVIWGYNFGSSGQSHYQDVPVPCRFVHRARTPTQPKSIARVADVYECFNAHHIMEKPLLYTRVRASEAQQLKDDFRARVRLHHYILKSREEFFQRRINATGYNVGNYRADEFDSLDAAYSEVYDDTLAAFFSGADGRARLAGAGR